MIRLMLLLVLLQVRWLSGIGTISRTNELKREAEVAFLKKNYAFAIKAWQEVLQTDKQPDPAIRLNLAHAYRLSGQKLKAAQQYRQVAQSSPAELQSVAQQQMGNLMADAGEYQQALELYKQALKANPQNRQARYNYELLRKYLDQQQDQEQQQAPDAPQPPKDEQQQDKQQQPGSNGKEGEPQQQQQSTPNAPQPGQQPPQGQQPGRNGGEREQQQGRSSGNQQGENPEANNPEDETVNQGSRPSQGIGSTDGNETTRLRLQRLNMSPERAEAILKAMRDTEAQYLQQVPRPQPARSRSGKGKPDW